MIGIFDSGVGGLTVMREIARQFPNTSIVYFGDTARVPYGDKSAETIQRYALESARFLLQQDIKLLVIACNSASAHAYQELREQMPVPVVDVIQPGVRAALGRGKRVAVLGTQATISSGVYARELKSRRPEVEVVSVACPLFVPLIEHCGTKHPALDLFVKEYLQPVKKSQADTVILGCTHYPFLREKIEEELGTGVRVIDSGTACAQEVQKYIGDGAGNRAIYRYFVSDDPEKFERLGVELVGNLSGVVRRCGINNYGDREHKRVEITG